MGYVCSIFLLIIHIFASSFSLAAATDQVYPHPLSSQENTLESPVQMVFGNPKAPIIIIEYSSITCGHCSEFSKKNFPIINQDYIKTGKVFYVIREFPLDMVSLFISQIIFDQPSPFDHRLREALLHHQENWILFKNPQKKALKILRLSGITPKHVEKSKRNIVLRKKLLNQRLKASSLKITSTPTFLICENTGTTIKQKDSVEGLIPYNKFKKKLDKVILKNEKI